MAVLFETVAAGPRLYRMSAMETEANGEALLARLRPTKFDRHGPPAGTGLWSV